MISTDKYWHDTSVINIEQHDITNINLQIQLVEVNSQDMSYELKAIITDRYLFVRQNSYLKNFNRLNSISLNRMNI